MYLPFGLTLMRLLQFPSSSLLINLDQSPPYSIAKADEQSYHRNDLNHLGTLSPYHDAPTVRKVSVDLPQDCTVDQVILLHRHGSRGPPSTENYIQKLVSALQAASQEIQKANLPPELQFLKEGYEYQFEPDNLTIIGRQQLFNHGVEFSLRYPTFRTDYVVSTTVPRVIDSAHFFVQGFLGREADNIEFFTTANCPECHVPVSWLNPWDNCPNVSHSRALQTSQKWANRYMPPIRDRLNELVPGVGFNLDTVRGALDACPYDLAARGVSPWCDVFTSHELRSLDYEMDLTMDTITGHDPSKDPGQLIGAIYIKKLIDRLTNATGEAQSLHLDFAHDLSVILPLSTMGLNKDAYPLPTEYLQKHRKMRTSNQSPFAASMIWEKFTCKSSFEGPQVRLILNGATFPLTNCEESEQDKEYGTCSLTAFKHVNQWSLDVEYNSQFWNATCGIGHKFLRHQEDLHSKFE